MRKVSLCAFALAAMGCGTAQSSYVKGDTTLGRVVVYRNGVAYFERYADVQGDALRLNVPSDKVDDFLKSLTVVDAKTGEPAPVSYPSQGAGGTIDMKIGLGQSSGPRKLRLTYVTEAPSWKPSYRVVVGKTGKVDLQGWAIVDNTSGEDWRDVKLGVGASSAMSFRFDLKGVRRVQRETLRDSDVFALAPPTGGAAYGGPGNPQRVMIEMTDDALALNDAAAQRQAEVMGAGRGNASPKSAPARSHHPAPAAAPAEPLQGVVETLRSGPGTVFVEGYASTADSDKNAAALARANKLRDQLVSRGLDPSKVVAIGKGDEEAPVGGARVVQAPTDAGAAQRAKKEQPQTAKPDAAGSRDPGAGEPIGTSHFESGAPMTVAKGTSAMVSILRSETEGEVVYLYDPESPRGNAQFPFKTLRFRNPTDGALESGPVSVFGEGRFVGEGLADPIPAKSVAFVPFALDRQIVVERKDADRDAIAKILTVQRGVFSTQIQHTKKAIFTLYNRLPEKVAVYLRHTVAPGYTMTKPPGRAEKTIDANTAEHLGGAHMFRVELEPNGKTEVTLEEATPVFRTTDIRTPEGLDLVRTYLNEASLDGALRADLEKLLKIHAEMTKIEQQIATARDQMTEYRTRMDELHAQLVTLRAVKAAGPLMTHLEKKLQEVSEKLSKATVDVVALQEKQMIARVQFQTGVGDLSLDAREKATAAR